MRFAAMAQQARPRPQLLSLRPATPDDADDIVALTIAAGDGLPLALWRQMAQPSEDPQALGRQRAQRLTGGYSYTRAEMAELDGSVAGGIIDYALGDEPDPITAETPALIVPLNELENLVCGSWYVNILAVKPLWRRLGLGRMLLEAAERRGRANGRAELSIIVSDANHPAQALYAAFGFHEKATRPMVKQGWDGPGQNWRLLTKKL